MAASQEHVLRLELEPSSDPSECQDLSGKNKKKRGRPRKYPLVEGIPSVSVKRKRGRPPKARVEEEREGEESDEQEKERKGADDEEGEEDTQKKKKKKKTVMMNMKERMEQKRRGRPRKNPVSAFVHIAGLKQDGLLKRGRGRPRLNPISTSSSPSHSKLIENSKKKRGRPRLNNTAYVLTTAKRQRGRPPKNLLYRLLELASSKKRGRPQKHVIAPVSFSVGKGKKAKNADGVVDEDNMEKTNNGSEGAMVSSVKRRGRPPKEAILLRHGNGLSEKTEVNVLETIKNDEIQKEKAQHSSDKTIPIRSLHPPISCQEDVMMKDVVKRFPFMDSVVKVFCIHTEPNFSLPWQMRRQVSSNSSGFIISGRRVLTNAHSVQHHTQVKVKKRGSDTKYLATVLAVGTECDIALLTVKSDEFWEGVPEMKFGGLPSLQDSVTVVGYPIGGDTISVTSGVVSRIEVTSYAHGATELLGVQIDAAINAGNSGGPAFNANSECVGIAFQALKQEDAENIGYIIPTPVISHFLSDYERNGNYTGFPILGIDWQKMENPDLRNALGMEAHQKGVLIRKVEATAPVAKYLQSSDIILSFDDIDIANDGTVTFRHGERIGFSYLVSQKFSGEKAKLKILRDKKCLEFSIELKTHKRVVPVHIKGLPPSYYIIAGIVFAAVSVPYLRSEYGKDYTFDTPVKLLDKLLYSVAQSEDEQLVVISQVLVADINIGYEDIVNTQILAVNGVNIKNLKHLANIVDNCQDRFLKFELEYDQILVLETQKAKAATPDILATHCIPSAASEDLK